jgi:plasmid maintenance system antidote protein VapI
MSESDAGWLDPHFAALMAGYDLLHEILEEKKPVSPNGTARIGKLIGNGPAIWLRLQAAYDAWHAEREVDVSKIPTLEQV